MNKEEIEKIIEVLPLERFFVSHNHSPNIEGSVKKCEGWNKCLAEVRKRIWTLYGPPTPLQDNNK